MGVPCNSYLAVAEAVERGLKRREKKGLEIAIMGPVCTLIVGRLDDSLKHGDHNPDME